MGDMAASALCGEAQLMSEIESSVLVVNRNNLVERPWGGKWIKQFKQAPAAVDAQSLPWGEAFEIAAFDLDDEASRFPSVVEFADGSRVELPELLAAQGERLLGTDFVQRYGKCYPLLPKTLDVKELLSVQGHPAGHTEVYIIIDAEPGATLRLGFTRDIDAVKLADELRHGLEQQAELLGLMKSDTDAGQVQQLVAPWFAARDAGIEALSPWLQNNVSRNLERAKALLYDLKELYWHTLDSMNAIAVEPGQVIHNATPQRLVSRQGGPASAEVHALGNPEKKEILALEIRRPGPTFRAWDNVRFPVREVNVAAAIDALNLQATRPEEFITERRAVEGRPGTFVSVDCEYFCVEHLTPDLGQPVQVPASAPHSLHCLAGAAELYDSKGRTVGKLERGDSALVPVGVGGYRIDAEKSTEIVRVTLPVD